MTPTVSEKITVVLPEHSKHSLMPLPMKCNKVVDGVNYMYFVNGSGILDKITTKEYVEGIGDKKDFKKLDVKTLIFKSSIINLSEGMDERDVKTNNLGFTFDKVKNPGEYKYFTEIYPEAMVDGNPPESGTTMVIVNSISKMKNQRLVDRKTRQEIVNYVDSIGAGKNGERTLSDILIFFGKNRGGRTIDEMVNILIDGETVVSTSGEKSESAPILFTGNNLDEFRRAFMDKNNPNLRLILNINKAKQFKLISYQGADNAKGWFLSGSYIAGSDEELQTYFTANKAIFDSLVTKIERLEEMENPTKEVISPVGASTNNVNLKNDLIAKLNGLVKTGKVTLPDGVMVIDFNEDELKEFISKGENTHVVKRIYEPKKEGEGVSYLHRLRKQLEGIVDMGNYILPEGTSIKKLTAADCEAHLQAYEKKLTESPSEKVGE